MIKSSSSKDKIEFLKQMSDRIIAFNTVYSKITGSVTSGILLSQLMYWWGKVNGGIFYKTDKEIREETTLGDYELVAAKNRLKELKIISIDRKGIPAKSYYTINIEILIDLITSSLNPRNLMVESKELVPEIQGTINNTKDYKQENTSIDFSPSGKVDEIKESLELNSAIQKNLGNEKTEENLKNKQKEVLRQMLYKQETIIQKKKKLDGDENLQIFVVLHQELCPSAKLTNPSVIEGIPRALSFFKSEFGADACTKLIAALKAFKKTQKYLYMKQTDPLLISASIIFKKKFIEETLYPLSFNQQQHGGIQNSQMSETELRQIEESDSEDRRRIMARRSQLQETFNSGV